MVKTQGHGHYKPGPERDSLTDLEFHPSDWLTLEHDIRYVALDHTFT